MLSLDARGVQCARVGAYHQNALVFVCVHVCVFQVQEFLELTLVVRLFCGEFGFP